MGAGPVVKLTILVLVYFSVVSWAIIFLKFKTVLKAKKDTESFLDFFWNKKRFDVIQQNLKEFAHSPLTVLFRDGYHELVRNQRQRTGANHDQQDNSDATQQADHVLFLFAHERKQARVGLLGAVLEFRDHLAV